MPCLQEGEHSLDWLKGIVWLLVRDIVIAPYENRVFISFSVATGLFWAFTPTVFFQQAAIFFYWISVRTTRWNFHFPLAWAWTWISNPWTMVPLYLAYYYLGSSILNFLGFNVADQLDMDFSSLHAFWISVQPSLLAFLIGSFLWSVLAAVIGYWIVRVVFWVRFRKVGTK